MEVHKAPLKNRVAVAVALNGQQQERKTLIVTRDMEWAALLKLISNKFKKLKATRLFFESGDEMVESDLNTEKLMDGVLLIASDGVEYAGQKATPKKVKSDEEMVLGGIASGDKRTTEAKTTLIQKSSVIETEAIEQLQATAKLQNMVYAVGLPDLHPGKGFPIGVAAASSAVFYPHLVGNDIGCGMALFKTSVQKRKIKLEQWVERLHGLESTWEGDSKQFLSSRGVQGTDFDASLGTIGGGNHFAELQQIDEIVDPEAFARLGLDDESLYLLIHSGSRAFGESILEAHLEAHGLRGLTPNSEAAKLYLSRHDWALNWARCNRALIAHRFMECITGKHLQGDLAQTHKAHLHEEQARLSSASGPESTADGSHLVFDVSHNCLRPKQFQKPTASSSPSSGETEILWLHRKGAAPSDEGPVVIPGSRGHHSYLVLPNPDATAQQVAAFSLAHGAGRRWNRGKALAVGEEMPRDSLLKTRLGSRVICEKKELLYEEVPDAYKEITDIIADLEHFNLIKVVAVLRPLITYKTRVKVYGK